MNQNETAIQYGLLEGVQVEVTHTSGEQNGQTFCGTLTCGIEIGRPVVIDNGEDVTSEVREISPDKKNDFNIVTAGGDTCVVTKKTSNQTAAVERPLSNYCY